MEDHRAGAVWRGHSRHANAVTLLQLGSRVIHKGRTAWGRGCPWHGDRFRSAGGSGWEELGTPGSDAAGETEPGRSNTSFLP